MDSIKHATARDPPWAAKSLRDFPEYQQVSSSPRALQQPQRCLCLRHLNGREHKGQVYRCCMQSTLVYNTDMAAAYCLSKDKGQIYLRVNIDDILQQEHKISIIMVSPESPYRSHFLLTNNLFVSFLSGLYHSLPPLCTGINDVRKSDQSLFHAGCSM